MADGSAVPPRNHPDLLQQALPRTPLWKRHWFHLILLSGIAILAASPWPGQWEPRVDEEPYFRRKVGIYIWGQVPDLLTAVADAKKLGMDYTVRAFIGPWSDTPPYKDDLRPLAEKLRDPGYQALMEEFEVIMLTAYDSVSYAAEYANRETLRSLQDSAAGAGGNTAKVDAPSLGVVQHLATMQDEEAEHYLAKVRQEFEEFSYALSQVDRVFIISNWEVEHDVPVPGLWPQMVRYLQARLDGIAQGRDRASRAGHPAKVSAAFEFTILPGFQGRPSGLVEIGTHLRGLDFLSYSSWWSIGWDYDAAEMRSSIQAAIQDIHGYAAPAGLPRRIIIGEFGEYWNLHPDGERLRAIVDASLGSGVEYLFNWVLYDQPGELDEHGRDASHFGKYFLDGELTPQGTAMQQWFVVPARQTPATAAAENR